MNVARNAAQALTDHVVLEVESIDRLYLNMYVPTLQRDLGVVAFFRQHRGQPFASGALMEPISDAFRPPVRRRAGHQPGAVRHRGAQG